MAKKADRFKGGIENLGTGPMSMPSRRRNLTASNWPQSCLRRRRSSSRIWKASCSEHKLLTGPVFPFDVRTDFVKVTDEHGAGADHPADQESRHHICDQGWRCEGRGEHPWQGDDHDRTRPCRPSKTRSKWSSRRSCWRSRWTASRSIGRLCRCCPDCTGWILPSRT